MTEVNDEAPRVSMPVSFEGNGAAAVMFLVDKETEPMVLEAASDGVARLLEIWDYTNILAIGCDLAILDPTMLAEDEWDCLCEVYSSYVDVDFKAILVKRSPYKASLPKRNSKHAPEPLSAGFLREEMLRSARVPKSRAIWQKKERQIQRLMYMLHRLDTSELRLRDVVERFEVSMRTAQRDLEVLLTADYAIEDGDEPGVYKFPDGYRSYYAYYSD